MITVTLLQCRDCRVTQLLDGAAELPEFCDSCGSDNTVANPVEVPAGSYLTQAGNVLKQ